MLGAIIGDIVGSRFEFNNHRDENFELFSKGCFFTDDTVLTAATAEAILRNESFAKTYRQWFNQYPLLSYGTKFIEWAAGSCLLPYNSYGNGAAMRVSPCAYVYKELTACLALAEQSASATHNHPQGIKGAKAVVHSIFLALNNKTKKEIKEAIEAEYYEMDFNLEHLKQYYKFNETCQDTVPQAIYTFLISNSFEDSIRKAISIGGDSDTVAAINGSIAEAYYGIPKPIADKAYEVLPAKIKKIIKQFKSI